MDYIKNNNLIEKSDSVVASGLGTGEQLSTGEIEYPSLLKRVQSTFIDALITFTLIGIFMYAANSINNENTILKIVAVVLGISYEPLMNAFFATVGQYVTRIKVRRVDNGGKINLFYAYLRFAFKTVLGWVSFLIMFKNTKRRAVHDFIAGTVVLNR